MFIALLAGMLSFAGPFFLNHILHSLNESTSQAMIYVFCLLVCSIARSICDGQAFFSGRRVGIRCRAVLIHEIYSKALRRIVKSSGNDKDKDKVEIQDSSSPKGKSSSSSSTKEETKSASIGQITNLMANDANQMLAFTLYFQYLLVVPLQVVGAVSALLYVLGWSALGGVAVMILVGPLSGLVGSWVSRTVSRMSESTDKRIQSVNEVKNCIFPLFSLFFFFLFIFQFGKMSKTIGCSFFS